MPEAPPIPAFPPTGEDQQVDPPEIQEHPLTPGQEPQILVPSTPAPAPVHIPPAPVARSSPRAPIAQVGPSTSTHLVEFIQISAQDFLVIQASFRDFATTSQAFAAAHIVMLQQMTKSHP